MTLIALFVAVAAKPAAMVCVALVVSRLIRRAAAATRHAVWLATIVALIALPLLSAVLPSMRWGRLDDGARRVAAVVSPAVPAPTATMGFPAASHSVASKVDTRWQSAAENVASWATLVWLLVAALLIVRRLTAEAHARRIVRAARHPSPELHRMVAWHPRIGATDVRVSDEVDSPAVVGVLRPAVLLPRAAEQWSAADVRVMLEHELEHVARRDCLMNLVADIAAAAYWCNPFVRLAARRLRLEAERACDERVVRGGADARGYAELLLRVAQSDRGSPSFAAAATAMSRTRELEHRFVALLENGIPRSPSSRVARAALAGGIALVTLPAAAIHVSAAHVPSVALVAMEPDRLGDSLTSPASERLPFQIDESELVRRTSAALSGPDSSLAHLLVTALDHAPQHEADFVAERARWALSRATNGALVEPLMQSPDDPDWRVQSYAAWTLAYAADSRVVPRLVPLLAHPIWRLRAMAAHALRTARDPRALPAMIAALNDPAWQVRMEAVAFVADVGGSEARELVRAHLDDRHVAVRAAARQALGQP